MEDFDGELSEVVEDVREFGSFHGVHDSPVDDSPLADEEADYAARIEAYEFQAKVEGKWKTVASGDRIGPKARILFEPVTTQNFRLNITKASDGPTINEIVLK